MTPYDHFIFKYSRRLNDAVKRPCGNFHSGKMQGYGQKNDMCLADLIKWVNSNKDKIDLHDYHHYYRFIK